MHYKQEFAELHKLVSQCTMAIAYMPYDDEVDYYVAKFPFNIPHDVIHIPNNKNTNPFEWAKKCIENYQGCKVLILIPGTRFDLWGTRHGNGGGWYDKFLSKVPNKWVRIGVCKKAQLSHTNLKREGWDQPVDWVVVKEGRFLWRIYKAI